MRELKSSIIFILLIIMIILSSPIYLLFFILLLLISPLFNKNNILNTEEIEYKLINRYNCSETVNFKINKKNLKYYKIIGNILNGDDIILLHGTATSSLVAWDKQLINQLINISSNIFMIELPYFGNNNPEGEYNIDTLINILFNFIKTLNKKPILICHSFGSYIGLELGIRYPDYINKIVAISPVGIFNFLGKYGSYWGLFFKLGFPTLFYKKLSYFETTIINLLKIFNINNNQIYKLILLLRTVSKSYFIVNKYIDVSPIGVRWNKPLIDNLINIKVPIALIFGEKDTITPYTTGKLANDIIGIPFHVIKGSHNPTNNIKNIKEIINSCNKPKYNNINILDKNYISSFYIF